MFVVIVDHPIPYHGVQLIPVRAEHRETTVKFAQSLSSVRDGEVDHSLTLLIHYTDVMFQVSPIDAHVELFSSPFQELEIEGPLWLRRGLIEGTRGTSLYRRSGPQSPPERSGLP